VRKKPIKKKMNIDLKDSRMHLTNFNCFNLKKVIERY